MLSHDVYGGCQPGARVAKLRGAQCAPQRKTTVANAHESVAKALEIDGAMAAALVDFDSGTTLATAG